MGRVLDPTGKYFSDRIVSRSDISSSERLLAPGGVDKSLERIFLGDSSMAVIVDDREDVWKGDQSQQLLLVKPFHHFTGPQFVEVVNHYIYAALFLFFKCEPTRDNPTRP